MTKRRGAPHAARLLTAGRTMRPADRLLTGLRCLASVQALDWQGLMRIPRAAPAGTDRDVLAALIGLRQSVDPSNSVLRWSPTSAYCNFTGAYSNWRTCQLTSRRACICSWQSRGYAQAESQYLRSMRADAVAILLHGAQCLFSIFNVHTLAYQYKA